MNSDIVKDGNGDFHIEGHCCDNCKDGKKCVSEMTQEELEKSTHEEFGPEHTKHIMLSEKEKARIKRDAADAADMIMKRWMRIAYDGGQKNPDMTFDEWQTKYFSQP